jgi:hypothetical protein
MIRSQQPALTLFAVGMIGLGILALVYGDFAMVWQPVASWIPGRSALAYGSGLVMLLGGTGLFMRATAAWSARLLFPYLIGWLLLKVPALLVAPQTKAVWLGVGELAVLLAGGWVLFARLAGLQEGSSLSFATGQPIQLSRHTHPEINSWTTKISKNVARMAQGRGQQRKADEISPKQRPWHGVGKRGSCATEERLGGSFKAVIDVKLDRLLDGVRLAAKQHGCDDSDLSHDVRRQHSCDGLGSFDLGWIGNKNLELLAGRCIV